MARSSGTAFGFAKNRGGALCSQTADNVRLTAAVSVVAQKVFDKPYRALVDLLKVSERDAHYRLSAERRYTAADVAKLLQSEEGIHFLVALMEKARPAWWKAILKMGALGSIEQRRQNDLKLMRKVFDADKASTAQFTDSFRAQDPDYFGVVLAGYDEAAALGDPDSSLAKGRRR